MFQWLKKLNRWFMLDVEEDLQDKDSLLEQSKSNRASLKEQCKENVELASEKIFEIVHENILRAVEKGESSYSTYIYNFNQDVGSVELKNIGAEVLKEFILNKLKERYSDDFYVSTHISSGDFPKSLNVYVSWER